MFLHMIPVPIGFEPVAKYFENLLRKVLKMIKNRIQLFGLAETRLGDQLTNCQNQCGWLN